MIPSIRIWNAYNAELYEEFDFNFLVLLNILLMLKLETSDSHSWEESLNCAYILVWINRYIIVDSLLLRSRQL